MKVIDKLLNIPFFYKSWSGLVNNKKMDVINEILSEFEFSHVLDLGCGPATNTHCFSQNYYVGVDKNKKYINKAKILYPELNFYNNDITKIEFNETSFNLIILNSILHHLADKEVTELFQKLINYLSDNGSIIITEPLYPSHNNKIQKFTMQLDRGNYFRTVSEYNKLYSPFLTVVKEIRYPLTIFGITGWSMCCRQLKSK